MVRVDLDPIYLLSLHHNTGYLAETATFLNLSIAEIIDSMRAEDNARL